MREKIKDVHCKSIRYYDRKIENETETHWTVQNVLFY